jgi:hypothetical protein
MERMVAHTTATLQQQKVIVFNIQIHHADGVNASLRSGAKVKLRMNGMTCHKSNARQPTDGSDRSRLRFNTACSAIYEGGDALCFQVCRSCQLGSSELLAQSWLPLTDVLAPIRGQGDPFGNLFGSTMHTLDVYDVASHARVLGTIVVEIAIRTTTLHAAGGVWALRTMAVPEMPQFVKDASEMAACDYMKKCALFVDHAKTASQILEALFCAAVEGSQRATFGAMSKFDRADEFSVGSTSPSDSSYLSECTTAFSECTNVSLQATAFSL